ncbi:MULTISPECIES: TonB-dependent receptor [unclassified Sphingopyxis]|uniref:TonB-dependent receptor n=1 Tax=unclassified Sphingopyxis TaxID=2614943 RepID=UPI000730CAD0|nr:MULTISPECIES: TonB-dependent receptor [unclassified Sphingopyxis]KTE24506.1 TonB-dependent receptor [Sphingopyxis sp. H057]KTE49484.1 TonB-dependent receptor [Sphingopyxis sp. H071]KTE52177.1 TonB-dependent receptor [Sphingopyxis sp. H073]KTE60490.1 TonB-dependent receptor [Sphingopyxis sp. H107]KTE63921.1 TonB-dependent receptor [Sphingopyxis sp. H100]
MIRLLAGAAALALPAAAMAQEGTSSGPSDEIVFADYRIDPYDIVVRGGLLPHNQHDGVQSSAILRNLDPGFGARVENRLRDEAGIVQFRRSDGRSAHPTSQGVTLRGLGGNASSRALVTLDGVPQADPFGGWVAWSAYDAINLGGIVVTRGGGSGVDGPGALAGTIGLYSTMTDGVEASAAYGSRDGWDASASAGGELGSGQVVIDGRYSRGDGFIPIAKGQRGSVDRAAPYEQGGVGLRLRFDAGDDSRIEASVRGFADRRDRGTDFTQSKVDGVDASVRFVHDPYGATQWLALGYIQLRDFESGFASVAAGRNSVAPALFQRVPATGLGARVEFRPAFDGGNPLRVGADWRRTTGRTEEDFFFTGTIPGRHRIAGGSSDTVGAFAEWTSGDANDGFLWTLSGRVDHWWLGEGYRLERNIGGSLITNLRFASRQGWEGSGRAGVRWTSDAFALRAAGYRGWRLPTLNELYRPFRVGAEVTTANEALEPERLWGGEVGADWQQGGTKLSVTLFANHLSNAIANVTLAPNLNQRRNLDAIDSKGVEFSAEQRVGPATLRATYAFTDAKVDASGAAVALDGRRPAQIAKHGGSVSLRSNGNGPFGGFATLRYIGSQNEDDLGLLRLDDALTLDAGLSWRVTDAVSIEARGENLTDELVPAAISSAGIVERATPRTMWIGGRVTF